MKILCPSKPKSPYREVIEELSKRAGVDVIFTKKLPEVKGVKVLLDRRGEPVNMEKLGRIVEKNPTFIVGGPEGIEIEADHVLSLGDYTLNHQIAIIVLLDLLFRVKNPRHPYTKH